MIKLLISVLFIAGCALVLPEGGEVKPLYAYTKMMKTESKEAFKNVEGVNTKVNSLMVYQSDWVTHKRLDHFQHHLSAVFNGDKFYGDCDDSAWTKARMLQVLRIVPDKDIRIAIVASPNIKPPAAFDHMIVVVTIEGTDYELDNNTKWLLPLRYTTYRYHSTMRLSEEGTWRAVVWK